MLIEYFNENILLPSNNIIDMINKYKYIDNITNKISVIENEYNTQIEEINSIDIGYYNINYNNTSTLLILQKELSIIKLLSKYALQNQNLDYKFIVKCLKLCMELSELLRIKIGQKKINLIKKGSSIQRCSYKFCNFKDKCTYNYNKKNNPCYQDHYVHNMVSHDLLSLIDYINMNNNINNKEILKSINTLSFVINHMETELKSKCLYQDENEWDKFHVLNCKNK